MTIPDASHPCWQRVIMGQKNITFEFLATKMLIGRLNQSYKKDASPANMRKLATELRDFFQKCAKLPKAQADMKKII